MSQKKTTKFKQHYFNRQTLLQLFFHKFNHQLVEFKLFHNFLTEYFLYEIESSSIPDEQYKDLKHKLIISFD